MGIDWKARFRNKTFWVALAAAIILLMQQLGINLPSNIADVVNTILSITVILGIVVDSSTPGVSDGVK